MRITLFILVADALVINAGFILSYLIRYGLPLPDNNFAPYRRSALFLTLIFMFSLSFFKLYKSRFKSSWDLFKRVFLGLFFGTLLSIAFVYVFRAGWHAFPTSVFALSFVVNLLLVFKLNQYILRARRMIRKRVILIGKNERDGIVHKRDVVAKLGTDQVNQLLTYNDIDEVAICERIKDDKSLSLLIHLIQKLKMNVVFSPAIYVELMSGKINGDDTYDFLSTFVGEKRDVEEFSMRCLDIIGSVLILLAVTPVVFLISLLIKISSAGPVFYRQQRVGKDGRIFTLYKFRTMVKDAERELGPVMASRGDPRVTRVGKILRTARLDELPQLLNVLRGDMSLVGPRPERPHFVKQHKALHELRLAVKPGLTGLAQIRSFYDLKPRHKIKYDYLYIQRRSFLLNVYILFLTVPAVLSRKGW